MRENILREIETEYETLRAENRVEEARRLAEASAADPMIGALVAERMRLFQEGARDALSNPVQAREIAANLTRRIAAIQQQLRNKLVTQGFREDYLQPVYRCEKCNDTGYTGDLIHERCDCYKHRMRNRIANDPSHGLDSRETFEAYDASIFPETPCGDSGTTQRAAMEARRALLETYASDYPANPRRNLLLYGGSGLGKTYLMNCIGNRIHQRGDEVLKLTAYQLSERIRASVFDRSPDSFTSLLEVPLLLLDDLGVEPLFNNLTVENLFTLVNERSLAGLHTIISTNLQLDELRARYTERVASRLLDKRSTVIIRFNGRDVRLGV